MSEFPFDEFKETDFNEFERFFKTNNVNPIYDHRANFQTNSPSFYEYLAKHNHLIKILAKRIYDYDKELAKHFDDWAKEFNKRFNDWDNTIKKFPENVEKLLIEWLQDGTLENIINEEIFNTKADKKHVDNIEDKINIRSQYYSDKPLVSFSFDDGRIEDWTRFKPIFDEEGIVGCICVITSQVGNSSSMTIDQLKELKKSGWSVASHLNTNQRLANLSLNQAEKELRLSQEFLKKHDLDYDVLVYPYGSYNDEILKLTRKYYPYAIDIDRNFPNLPRDFRNTRIYRKSGLSQPGGTLEKCKKFVDDAIENGDWVIFEDHSHYEFYDNQENLELLRELIQYVKYKGVEIVSYREGIKRKANIIEVWDDVKGTNFRVNVNGNVVSNTTPYVFDAISANSNVTSDTPPTDRTIFPEKSVTEYRIDKAQATERGFTNAGVLKTHNHDSAYYSYQTFDIYRENKTLRRYWNGSENTWSEWQEYINPDKEIHDYYILGTIATGSMLSNNSPLTDYPSRAVSQYRIDGTASTQKGFPSSEGGFLTTHRHDSNYYGYQTFDVYQKNKRYRRNWLENEKKWSDWVVIYDITQ